MTKYATLLVLGFVAILLASTPTVSAAVTTNISIPIALSVFVPCALGGVGEVISLSGDLHLLATTTLDPSGGFHASVQANPEGVSAVGLISGDMYRATGLTRTEINVVVAIQSTFINRFYMIGMGPGNNLRVSDTFVITVNANGVVTATQSISNITCM